MLLIGETLKSLADMNLLPALSFPTLPCASYLTARCLSLSSFDHLVTIHERFVCLRDYIST